MKNLIKNFFLFITVLMVGIIMFPSCEDSLMLDDLLLDSTQVSMYNQFTGDSLSLEDSMTIGDINQKMDYYKNLISYVDTTNILGVWHETTIKYDYIVVNLDSSGNVLDSNIVNKDVIVPKWHLFGYTDTSKYHVTSGFEIPNRTIDQLKYYIKDTVFTDTINGEISSYNIKVPTILSHTYSDDECNGNYTLDYVCETYFYYKDGILSEYFYTLSGYKKYLDGNLPEMDSTLNHDVFYLQYETSVISDKLTKTYSVLIDESTYVRTYRTYNIVLSPGEYQ